MSNSESITFENKKIKQIIEHYGPAKAISHLFEEYRVSGGNRDAFVAALIARMCLIESRTKTMESNHGKS
ncbi:hypothetical protein JHL22_05060 [Advenella sp. WQ 585]|uniref:Uncharacterized protein n=1 Tax=Advenella mandrilli TaxID=2800330 RepID=A0ABS1EFI1_9BURK|nr:hypothetical protein [Advenella mandrilli]